MYVMGLGSECTCKLHKNIKTQSSGADPRGSGLGACSRGARGLRRRGRRVLRNGEMKGSVEEEGCAFGNKNDKILDE